VGNTHTHIYTRQEVQVTPIPITPQKAQEQSAANQQLSDQHDVGPQRPIRYAALVQLIHCVE